MFRDPDARMFDATLQVIRLFSATIAGVCTVAYACFQLNRRIIGQSRGYVSQLRDPRLCGFLYRCVVSLSAKSFPFATRRSSRRLESIAKP